MSENFEALLEKSLAKVVMRPGQLIMGEVVEANDDYVVVSAGLKSDAEIPAAEFKDSVGEMTVKVGDKVEVVLDAVEDGSGATRLSRERAVHERAWADLRKAHEEGSIVNGVISGKVKGGYTVRMNSLRAFLPGSLVDAHPGKPPTYAEGHELGFKIIKLDRQRDNIVVSRRAISETEPVGGREQLLNSLKDGMLVKGVVKNLTEYGAFVNLGGLDGLLHVTDLAWRRIHHPSEVLTVGDEIETRVLKFDRENERVSLGLKQMGDDPWQDIERRYPKNTRLFGKVTNVTEYGAFVEVEAGVEGLVHLSEMDWLNRNIHPNKVCKVGDEVEVMVLSLDAPRRRISLGIKQCKPNPWTEFAANHRKGDRVKGVIRTITDFGIFIAVDGEIDGLVHLSDMAWGWPGEEIIKNYKKGDELEAVVLAVDAGRERISLGLKQLNEDPFIEFITENGKGSTVKGTVKDVTVRGAVVQLGQNVEGYLRASEISRDLVEDARTALSTGDEVEAKVIGISRRDRNISLSVKIRETEMEGEAVQEYQRDASLEGAKLGDKLKEKLGEQLP